MNLDCLIDDAPRCFRREELRFTRFAGRHCGTRVFQIGGAINQQPRRVEPRRHISKFLLDQLMLAQGFAKLQPRLCMQQTFIQRSPRHAARCRADARAKHIERLQTETQPISLITNHVFRGDFAVLEFEFADWMWRDHFRSFSDTEAGHSRRNDEGGDFRATVGSGARARKDCVKISNAGVGNESFATVNYVAVVIDLRAGLQCRNVRAGIRFSQSKRRDCSSRARAGEPKIAHMFGGRQTDRVRSQALHDEREIRQRRAVRKRLANDAESPQVKRLTRSCDCIPQEIIFGE